MLIGVKFCGGCNPRYNRGKSFETIKEHLEEMAEFEIAEEGKEYDYLLVIGGCTNCCASYCQYESKNDTILMWDEKHIDEIVNKLKNRRNDF